jgi:hypothetical protein
MLGTLSQGKHRAGIQAHQVSHSGGGSRFRTFSKAVSSQCHSNVQNRFIPHQ